MVRTRGFRNHVTTLLGLALPSIDANGLDKTLHTLSFVQYVASPSVTLQKMKRGVGAAAI